MLIAIRVSALGFMRPNIAEEVGSRNDQTLLPPRLKVENA
jgi:hypothetical protein